MKCSAYADMNLGMTRGENGEKVQLTDARLLSLLASKDRAVRKAAYTNIMNGYNKFGNTIAATYAGQREGGHLQQPRASLSTAAVRRRCIRTRSTRSVYDSLIDAVHGGIGTLNEYLSIKKEQLGRARSAHVRPVRTGRRTALTSRWTSRMRSKCSWRRSSRWAKIM